MAKLHRVGRQTVSGVPPPTDTRPLPVPYGRNVVERRPRPPEGATAASKAKPLLAAAFPVQSLLKAA